MKCPYCGAKEAKVNGSNLLEGSTIHSSVCCKNPSCTAYKPIFYEPHPDMSSEKKLEYKKVIKNE